MHVTPLVWVVTIVVTVAVLAFDIAIVGRRPHAPSRAEVVGFLAFYLTLSVAFGIGVWLVSGGQYGGEFFAGWLTEYSLSVDNLFIFIVILSRLSVPRTYHQEALFIGIVLALVMRGIFIALGGAAIEQFSWVFYVFGAFLVYTGAKLALSGPEDEDEYEEPTLVSYARRKLPHTEIYRGARLWTREHGKLLFTPMFIVMLALGMTDLLFALDSIPAIYGLTEEPYLVFTANIFALMGLRQLYFLIGGLLERLVYLSYGLAILLGFIGVKLVLHALHTNELPFVNGGDPVLSAPEISIPVSLAVILGILVVTAVASLLVSANETPEERDARTGPRRESHDHRDEDDSGDPGESIDR